MKPSLNTRLLLRSRLMSASKHAHMYTNLHVLLSNASAMASDSPIVPKLGVRFVDMLQTELTEKITPLQLRFEVEWDAKGATPESAPVPCPSRIVFQFTVCSRDGSGLFACPVEPVQCTARMDTQPALLDAVIFLRANPTALSAPTVHVLAQWSDALTGDVAAWHVSHELLSQLRGRAPLKFGRVTIRPTGPGTTSTIEADKVDDLRRIFGPEPIATVGDGLFDARARDAVQDAAASTRDLESFPCAKYHDTGTCIHENTGINWITPVDRRLLGRGEIVPDVPRDLSGAPEIGARLAAQLHRLCDSVAPESTASGIALRTWLTCMAHCSVARVRSSRDGVSSRPVPWTSVANGHGGYTVRAHTPETHVARICELWKAHESVASAFFLRRVLYAAPGEQPVTSVVAIPRAWSKEGLFPSADPDVPENAMLYVPGAWMWPIFLAGPQAAALGPRSFANGAMGIWTPLDLPRISVDCAESNVSKEFEDNRNRVIRSALEARALSFASPRSPESPSILTHTVCMRGHGKFSDLVERK